MITTLTLENFRGFAKHTLTFTELTIIVGKNNAGKSTVVEALRLIALITSRYKNLTYRKSPTWIALPQRFFGVSPSLKNMEINFDSLFHQYQEPPAKIDADFKDGSSVTIYLQDEDKVYAVLKNSEGKIIKNRQEAAKANLANVAIMPQVTPVQRNEVILNSEYVKRSMSSHLSSLHFRNQLKIFKELFKNFQSKVEDTWPGVQIKELIVESNLPGEPIYLDVRNEDFVAEISAMGHGLQMWLQTMWFLTRSEQAATVILDEPDVYMHADLQRRIIRFIRTVFPQVLLTTHSVEIMSEVQPDEILIIDRKGAQSVSASSVPAVQKLIESVGSTHNIHLARLWGARKFVFLEGKDMSILKQIQNTLFPNSDVPLDVIPNMSIGGWGGWKYVLGSSMTLKNALGQKIKTYCIFDSDYHTEETIDERITEAKSHEIHICIWTKKEIENYLLVPEAIQRIICKKIPKRVVCPSCEEIQLLVDELASEKEEVVFDGFASEILSNKRSLGSGGANKLARKLIKEKKAKIGLSSMVSGKELLTQLSKWSQNEFGVSLSAIALARELTAEEIPKELRDAVSAIELNQSILR